MKKLQILLSLAAVLLTLTGCKKDNEKSGPSGETVTLSATLGGGEKTEIDGFDMKWSAGDAVNVNRENYTAKFALGYETAIFENVKSADKYEAYYPASLYDKDNNKYVLPATQTYNAENCNILSGINPMYAKTETKELHFNHICALVKLQVTGTGIVKQIIVTSTDNLCGEFEVQSGDNDHYYAHITGSGNTVTLKCGDAGVNLKENEATTFYIALPQGVLGNLTFKCSGDAGEWTSQPIATATLTAGKLYTKSLENVEMKPAVFSVAADKTVEFAPGNLYWDGSAFYFEANQWNYCVENYHWSDDWGTLVGTWNSAHVSYFYWSKDAKEAVKAEFNGGQAMSVDDNFFTNATPTTANPAFQVSDETAGTWRTLSGDEWNYLLSINPEAYEQQEGYGREDALKLSKWSAVTFGESGPTVNGLIIMPDGWQGTLEATTDFNS